MITLRATFSVTLLDSYDLGIWWPSLVTNLRAICDDQRKKMITLTITKGVSGNWSFVLQFEQSNGYRKDKVVNLLNYHNYIHLK